MVSILGLVQYLLLLIVAYAGISLGLPIFLRFLTEAGQMRPNYAGQEIPLGAGLHLILLLPVMHALALLAGVPGFPVDLSLLVTLTLVGFGLAGLVDDCLGTPQDKGFRGHFIALIREKRLTSGAFKALFGGTVALLAALALPVIDAKAFGPWYQILLNALVLASAANLVNLFDLRPGRAGKIFLLGLLICAALAVRIERFGAPILLLTVMFIPLFRRDLRAELMLGDTGSYLLGATLGLAMVFWLTLHAKIVALVLLLLLQALSERFSFSALIERFGFLRLLDRLGRRTER